MKRNLFLDRHPVLYHLREHSREAAGLALGLMVVLWLCLCCWSAGRRLENSFGSHGSLVRGTIGGVKSTNAPGPPAR